MAREAQPPHQEECADAKGALLLVAREFTDRGAGASIGDPGRYKDLCGRCFFWR